MTWKITLANDDTGTRVVYSHVSTYEDAVILAETLELLHTNWPRTPVTSAHPTWVDTEEFVNTDGENELTLEQAVLWALER